MGETLSVRRLDHQPARHAQMDEQASLRLGVEQQELAAPSRSRQPPTGESGGQTLDLQRPTHHDRRACDRGHLMTGDVHREDATHGLDLGQLRHRRTSATPSAADEEPAMSW